MSAAYGINRGAAKNESALYGRVSVPAPESRPISYVFREASLHGPSSTQSLPRSAPGHRGLDTSRPRSHGL